VKRMYHPLADRPTEETHSMKVTTRDDLMAWLDGLSRSSVLIGPKAVEEQILYRPVTGSSEVSFDFTKTDLSVKEYFLPSSHVILSIERGEEGLRVGEPSVGEERVIFGLRPCDARALRALDALFLEEEPVDPYYAEFREKTTLIGLACREMGAECFCTSLGLRPDEAGDVDLMLTEIDGGYAVQVVTEKGKAILGDLPLEEVEGRLPRPALREDTVIPDAETWPLHFDHVYWARLADYCLSCRLCTYVCPTCRCFDVRDYETPTPHDSHGSSIERLRAWDSCLAENYRRIAGGHSPRPTKAQRLRNRFYCKFCYYPQDFGPIACVGCGRCIAKCPVNVDIVEVLESVAAL
jgi:sulfhydrogenase subunit beta (sulfur reductase)